VLLHSALGDSRLWSRQLPALAARFDVVAPDLPGFGETPEPDGSFSFVDAVAPLLPAALVGNSLGGRVALGTALAFPSQVERLVLVAPGLDGWEWSDELAGYWAEEEAAAEAGDLDRAVQVNLDFWLPQELHEEVRPQVRRAFELQTAHEPPEVRWPEAAVALAELDVPTLVVVGDRDVADFRGIAEHLADEIPGARLEVVEGAGHLVGLERPDELERLLLAFL
jgi:3-oxoadipate enol-lactonase